MITLITGPIHSGKTTRLIDEFNRCTEGDGFASIKLINGNEVEGFDILRLSTGHRMPFARKGTFTKGWNLCCSYGPYGFSADAVAEVSDVMGRLQEQPDVTLFLDEVGALELEDKCFHDTVKKIVASGRDAFLTVRDINLNKVIEKYGLEDVEIIRTGERFV